MKKTILLLGILIGLITCAEARDYKILIDPFQKKAHTFGKELAKIAAKANLNINTEASSGSVSDLVAVGMGNADFAVCQYEVFQKFMTQRNLQSLGKNIQIVLPLYIEKCLFLVRKDRNIQRIEDLKDKKINLGMVNSGTFYLARMILQKASLSENQLHPQYSSDQDALKMLLDGKIDGMFLVDGTSCPLFKKIKTTPLPLKILRENRELRRIYLRFKNADVKGDKIRLFSFSTPLLSRIGATRRLYSIEGIDPFTCSFQDKRVQTLGVPSLLVVNKNVPSQVVQKACQLILTDKKFSLKKYSQWDRMHSGEFLSLIRNTPFPIHQGALHYVHGYTGGSMIKFASGCPKNLYGQIGRDIQKIVRQKGINLRTIPTRGPSENIMTVAMGQADMAICRMDVLLSMAANNPEIALHLRSALPLFYERIHLLARRDANINSLADLRGKRVNVGPLSCGNTLMANHFIRASNLDPVLDVTIHHFNQNVALKRLLKGDLDAAFFTTRGSDTDLQKIPTSANITHVSITQNDLINLRNNQDIFKFNMPYKVVTITEDQYPWLQSSVQTVASPCVILCRSDMDPHKIQDICQTIIQKTPTLKRGIWQGYDRARFVHMLSSSEITLAPHRGVETMIRDKTIRVHRDLDRLRLALEVYRTDMGTYPKQMVDLMDKPEGVVNWQGPYVKDRQDLTDPWNRAYSYNYNDKENTFTITCYGADGRLGGEGDHRDISSNDLPGRVTITGKSGNTVPNKK